MYKVNTRDRSFAKISENRAIREAEAEEALRQHLLTMKPKRQPKPRAHFVDTQLITSKTKKMIAGLRKIMLPRGKFSGAMLRDIRAGRKPIAA